MVSQRDLVEAHSFNRRRLVTTFVSGASGGRETEPARPGRAVIGGLALGALLMAGAAVSGVLSRTQADGSDHSPSPSVSQGEVEPYR